MIDDWRYDDGKMVEATLPYRIHTSGNPHK